MIDEASFGTITGINSDGTANFGDKNPFVSFFRGTRLNHAKTVMQGAPVYDPVDMIKIIKPGERDEIHRMADEYDKMRYREQWRAYCDGIQAQISGTPLETLLPANPELVATLKALKVYTVQQLSELGDAAVGNLQFGHDLRKKAQKYLAVAEKGVEYHRIQHETEEKDSRIRELEGRLALLEDRMRQEAVRAQQVRVPEPGAYIPPEPHAGFAPALQQPVNSPAPPPLLADDEDDLTPTKRGPGRPPKN